MADKKLVEQYYTPPPKLGNWEGFKLFLWNGETSQFMGRTAGSWAKILLFYLLFYAALAGFFAGLLTIFWQTLEEDRPKYQLDKGLIGSNPGLGFRPMPPEAKLGSTLVWYQANKPENLKYWFETVDTFLDEYKIDKNSKNEKNEKKIENQMHCDFSTPRQPGKVCLFSAEDLGNCSPGRSGHKFGFPERKPCIFLKLNKIYNWMPEVYNDTGALPSHMPSYLKTAIAELSNPKERNTIWISCDGENPADVENLGPMHYFPRRGFPEYYFPFQNIEGYLPPIVAVQFERPKSGVLINIECKAWAKNIRHDRADRRGSVHFEIMID